MSRRTPATAKPTSKAHVPSEHPDEPGCCATCHLRLDLPNGAHVAPSDLPTPDPDTRAITARITAEKD